MFTISGDTGCSFTNLDSIVPPAAPAEGGAGQDDPSTNTFAG